MTSRSFTIRLHRAFDYVPVEYDVETIYYFQALTDNRAPLTKIVCATGTELVAESVREIQQRCLGC